MQIPLLLIGGLKTESGVCVLELLLIVVVP